MSQAAGSGRPSDNNFATGGEFSMKVETLDLLTTSMPRFLGSQPLSRIRHQYQF